MIGLWQAEQRVTCIDGRSCPYPWHPSLRYMFAGVIGGWNRGFTGQTCGEDWDWWHRDSLKELEHGAATTGSICGRSQALDKSKAPLLSGE